MGASVLLYRQSPLEFPDSPDSTGHLKPGLPIGHLKPFFFYIDKKNENFVSLGSREAFPFPIDGILDIHQERTSSRRRQGTRRSLLASGLLAAQQAVRRGVMGVGAVLRYRCPLAYMRRPPQQADAAPDLAASASSSSRCNRRRQGGIVITGLVGSAPAAIDRVLSGGRSCVLFWSQSAPLRLVGSRSRLFPDKSKLSSRR